MCQIVHILPLLDLDLATLYKLHAQMDCVEPASPRPGR